MPAGGNNKHLYPPLCFSGENQVNTSDEYMIPTPLFSSDRQFDEI